MANVMFKKGLLANLPATHAEGTFYVTTDERAIYLDVDNSNRIRLGDFQEFNSLSALKANTNPSTTALYYVSDINCLAKWNGTDYIQINLDTGATSFEVVGNGNAVTAVGYDAATRKLTLTKGETFATRAYVGEIPTDKGNTIIEYINKKAEETLSAAQGGSSETAASVAQALQNYKDLTDPRLEALEAVDHEHANKAELDLIAAGDKAKWDAMEQNAKDYADSLAGNYDAAGTGAEEAGKVQTKLDEEVLRAKAAEEANANAAKAADDKAVAAQGEIDALEAKVGEVPADKTVVQMISEAQTAATYDDTQVKADIEANSDAIAKLNDGATVEGSVDYKIAQAVAAIMENPDETMNSINELVTWVNDHAQDALELSNKVSANEGDIAALEGLVGDKAVATQITEAIAAALKVEGVDKYALASDLTAAIGRIAAMEGKVAGWDDAAAKVHEHSNKALLDTYTQTEADLADAVAKKHAHENAEELAKIASGDKEKWDVAAGKAHEHANKAELDLIASGDKAKWDGAVTDIATVKDDYLKSTDKTELQGNIDTLAGNVYTKTEVDNAITAAITWGSF